VVGFLPKYPVSFAADEYQVLCSVQNRRELVYYIDNVYSTGVQLPILKLPCFPLERIGVPTVRLPGENPC
jgi:hypothetical protein